MRLRFQEPTMTHSRWTILTLSCLAAALVGCDHYNKPARLKPEADPYLRQGRVQFEDRWTASHVKVVREPDTKRLPGGSLKVTLTLRNLTDDNLWCPIKTTFLDADHHELPDQTNFEPTMLGRSTVTEYTVTSFSDKAADYQIIIKKGMKTNRRLR